MTDQTAGMLPGRFERISDALEGILTRRFVRIVAPILFGLVMVAVAAGAVIKPEHNWDIAPYIALAMEPETPGTAALHQRTYDLLEGSASVGQWHTLTQGNSYNIALYENPDYFASQFGMYRVKWGYIETLRLLGPFTGYIEATQIINIVSILVIGSVLLMWLHRFDAIEGSLILAPVMLLMGFLNMGQSAGPDLMTFAAFTVALYLLRIGRDWSAVPFVLLAFAIRPDGIVFIFALLLAAVVIGGRKLPLLVAFALSVGGYLLITGNLDHPGWWPHFVFSNVELQNDMRGFAPAFDLMVYIKGLVRGVSVGLRNNDWLQVCAILLLAWVLLRRAGRQPVGIAASLFLAQVLCVGGKFVSFPLPDDRVYFLYVILATVLLLESWKPRLDLAAKDGASSS